jgi:hypothetical protein
LEDLEAEFLPVVGEPTILRVDFVERDGTAIKVTSHMDVTIKPPVPQPRRARQWRQE